MLGPQPLLLHHAGEAAWASGDVVRAIAAHRGAVAGQPDLVEIRISLSLLLREVGASDEARHHGRVAMVTHPALPRAVMAAALATESTRLIARMTSLDPVDVGAWINLGAMRLRDTALAAAAQACRRALALAPAASEALSNFGAVTLALGEPSQAIERQARAVATRAAEALHSNLLFTLLSDPETDDRDLLAEARRWGRKAREIARPLQRPTVGADAERPLVLGYVSADFRRHPVADNVIELLQRHDRTQFKVNCYAEIRRADAMTETFRAISDRWVPIAGRSDADVAAEIRRDRVDLLVFLGGHTASNRLALAAWRPAPVQISYHAPATTGLEEIDYWLSDGELTPPGWDDRFAEQVYRLPVFYSFRAPEVAVAQGPSGRGGPLRFGSFNNPGKLNDAVFAAWSRVLERVPAARLRLGYRGFFEDPALPRRVRRAMASVADRIEFAPQAENAAAHLDRLQDVDVILDTFPFGGATSTFEALWMGVPVVSLRGDRFVGRVGAAICRTIGLDELVAGDADSYVDRAARLIGDRERLRDLRSGLRARLMRSALMDYPRQALALEAAYREMWRRCCRLK